MKSTMKRTLGIFTSIFSLALVSCQQEADILNETQNQTFTGTASTTDTSTSGNAVFLVIDEESIDNGNPPNNFSETDVNDQISALNQRATLKYFRENVGRVIDLYTGEVGDEGWFALKTIPNSWKNVGPTQNGTQNYLQAGPGLGGGNDDPEVLLDKIPNVTPLRATGLKMLIGQTILALVYDGDVSINYGPLNGSLKGETLGLVALEVVAVKKRTDGSSGSLPRVTVRIRSVETVKNLPLKLFANAPVPQSSSEPYDITPPTNVNAISLVEAP